MKCRPGGGGGGGYARLFHNSEFPPGIDDVNLDPEGDILFLESLLYDNSSPRPPEEFNSENPTESFSPSPIPVEDSDSLMEEIDIGCERLIVMTQYHRVLRVMISTRKMTIILPPIPSLKSYHRDRNKILRSREMPLNSNHENFLAPSSTPKLILLLTFSSENEDKVFNHGVLASKEKSPSSLSHRGFKASKLFHQKSPMLISGDNTPDLGVRHPHFYPLDHPSREARCLDVPVFEALNARGFCPSITRASHPQLHLGIRYPNLID
ncbi:hypothetical protein Tco_0074145 [Tanacetum coccineum]